MKTIQKPLTALAMLALVCALPGCARAQDAQDAPEGQEESAPVTSLENQQQEESYAVGLSFGRSLSDQGVEVDFDVLLQGLRDGFEGNEPLLGDDQVQAAMVRLQQEMATRQQEQRAAAAEEAKAAGEAFLAENAEREGVVVLPSGLQYEVLEEGDGPSPSADDQVTVHYRGTLVDGTQFDSSYERGEPATLTLDRVIRGWTEAIPMMKVGSKWKLFIPSDLAYGERGGGQVIPPHSALIFEVELLGIGDTAAEE